MKLKDFIPALAWIPNYTKTHLKGDLSAGLTVGIMLVPQGMAYAMIAGLPPIYGLYAATIPLVLYAILGTSRHLAVGPVAMVSLLTASGIGLIAEGGTEMYIALAITLAFFVGIIQFLLGLFRLGFLVTLLSHPVISGFTSAAALIIGLSQLKHLLGLNIPRSHYVHEILQNAIKQASEINWITVLIGLTGIGIIIGLKKVNKAIPGSLIAVIFGILIVWLANLTSYDVKIVGEIPKGLPSFSVPTFEGETWKKLIPIALTIALVGFMESIAVAKSIQAKHRNYKVIPNQELIALGIANIGGSFFQSFPTTGGFSRTAVNNQSGAETGFASILSAILVLLTLLFLTPLFYYLPNAILASIIMVAVFGLIDFKEAKHLWKSDKMDFWMLIATFIATLSLGIEKGIGLGVILSLVVVIFRSTRPHVAILANVPNSHFYRNVNRFKNLVERSDILIMRFDADLYFANVSFFKDKIEEEIKRKGSQLKVIIINTDSINNLDSSACHAIQEIIEVNKEQGIESYFSGVKGPVRDAFERSGLVSLIGDQYFFMSVQEAVDFYNSKNKKPSIGEFGEYTSQTSI